MQTIAHKPLIFTQDLKCNDIYNKSKNGHSRTCSFHFMSKISIVICWVFNLGWYLMSNWDAPRCTPGGLASNLRTVQATELYKGLNESSFKDNQVTPGDFLNFHFYIFSRIV